MYNTKSARVEKSFRQVGRFLTYPIRHNLLPHGDHLTPSLPPSISPRPPHPPPLITHLPEFPSSHSLVSVHISLSFNYLFIKADELKVYSNIVYRVTFCCLYFKVILGDKVNLVTYRHVIWYSSSLSSPPSLSSFFFMSTLLITLCI